jgi:hypothetical protein
MEMEKQSNKKIHVEEMGEGGTHSGHVEGGKPREGLCKNIIIDFISQISTK